MWQNCCATSRLTSVNFPCLLLSIRAYHCLVSTAVNGMLVGCSDISVTNICSEVGAWPRLLLYYLHVALAYSSSSSFLSLSLCLSLSLPMPMPPTVPVLVLVLKYHLWSLKPKITAMSIVFHTPRARVVTKSLYYEVAVVPHLPSPCCNYTWVLYFFPNNRLVNCCVVGNIGLRGDIIFA